jgi:3-isopropylmalate dehydrogenase
MAAALAVLRAAAVGFDVDIVPVDGGADTFRRTGEPMSAASIDIVRTSDSTLKGPVGLPDVRYPDGTEAGVLGGVLRSGLDLYANIRPITLLPGVRSPLRTNEPIDYVMVRENTEGLYAARGRGVGTVDAIADTMMITRRGTERIVRRAFEIAARRHGAPRDGVSRVTCVDKANVLRSMFFFREIFLEVADQYPDVEAECMYVDAAAQALVQRPAHFDVLVTENMFGDILSDLGGATVGGIAMCPSGNVGDSGSYFEPIHGSAPDIAGRGVANPIGQILAAAMMLDHLGEAAAGDRVRAAVTDALASLDIAESGAVRGGADAVADAVIARLPHDN